MGESLPLLIVREVILNLDEAVRLLFIKDGAAHKIRSIIDIYYIQIKLSYIGGRIKIIRHPCP